MSQPTITTEHDARLRPEDAFVHVGVGTIQVHLPDIDGTAPGSVPVDHVVVVVNRNTQPICVLTGMGRKLASLGPRRRFRFTAQEAPDDWSAVKF